MAGIAKKSFDSPDEVRTPDKTRLEIVDLGSHKAARMTAQPGWTWSECVKPVAGTDRCQARHVGVVVAGSVSLDPEHGSPEEIPGCVAHAHAAWYDPTGTNREPVVP